MQITILTMLAGLAVSGPFARSETTPAPSSTTIDHCLVSLIADIDVPAEESGRLVEVTIERGMQVQQGMLLARIDDRQPQLDKFAAEMKRAAALARAEDDIEVKYAESSFAVADAELVQKEQINLNSPGSTPISEIRRLRLTRRRAELQIDKSKLDLKVAKMTASIEQSAVQSAEENIARRRIISPIDGVVVDMVRQKGEWINAGEPLARVVRMDRLHVEGFLNVKDFDAAEVDRRQVTVEVELARGRRAQFRGVVESVDALVISGGRYRVQATVENRSENGHWLLRPGTTAAMTIHLR